ncbi:hypothetical protein INS49_002485 [Diaporthe citri]|uniref:uncharacterized protein n=1 Tax=Diaporthe citri TaxID=83186 RepID=UPI001C81E1AE|nr:uncharacterized protein INS49_002485 [Diaporthe citri]KAG6368281.1 hypothetical protein INS49_002485 [Diaporthe citri]
MAEPVAIVRISCRLPGGANDLNSLWELLADGGEAWSPVPASRFNAAAFHHPNADDPNGTNNHRGGHFIDGDIRDFDHAFFHLSGQQAAAMDPQQRILLELAYEALGSAGLSREAIGGSRTAVYAAIFGMDYERNLAQDVLDLPVYQSVGTGTAILANRISHVFDLRGPSVTLDTGCSGGLVALHHACRSLWNGETDAALVASANLQLMPDQYIGMNNQHMGFAVVVLKRLCDAVRGRDPVRSIIINTGMNQDGHTASGITHPNRSAQADLIRETYARARLRPQDVLYVEAHGTGTVAGDSEELAAIDEVTPRARAAAFAAGRLSHRTALCVSFHRGFMAATSKARGLPPGAMLSLGLGEHDTVPLINDLSRGHAVVACVNSPNSVTVSGDAAAVDEVLERVKARGDGIFCRKLLVGTAYRRHHMKAVAADYRVRLGELDLTKASARTRRKEEDHSDVSMFSSVTGQVLSSHLGPSYWVENLVSPVRFSDAVQTAMRTHSSLVGGHTLFVEIGPHPALAGPVRQCLADTQVPKLEYEYLSVLRRGLNAVSSVLELAGRLFERGVTVNFREVLALTSGADTAIVEPDLPTYSWDRSVKHWHESRLNREYRMRKEAYHDLLGVRMIESSQPRWRHVVGLTTLPWLADHVIDNLTIFPGAGYVCMASEAVFQLAAEQKSPRILKALAFRDIAFLRALVVPEPPQRVELQLSLEHQSAAPLLEFSFRVMAFFEDEWHEHCTGYVEGILSQVGELEAGESAVIQQCSTNGTVMDPAKLYTDLAASGNTYGPTFRGIRSLSMAADGTRTAAVIRVPDIAAIMPAQHQARHILHPSTFDSMFHVGVPMIRHIHGAGSVMPVHIGEILMSTQVPALKDPGSELDVSAEVTSSHFRTTSIEMVVTDGYGHSIMHASEIESRSLGEHIREADSAADAQGTCYELSWKPDLDFLRIGDLPTKPSISDLGYGTIETYDLTDTSPTFVEEARKNADGRSLRFQVLDEQGSLEAQGFTPHAYDVVLASDPRSIAHTPTLLRNTGLLVLVLKSETDFDEAWHTRLRQTCRDFEIQLSFKDAALDAFVVVVRDLNTGTAQSNVRLVTHSAIEEAPCWIIQLQGRLSANGVRVTRETMSQFSAESESGVGTCTVIVDDLPFPILSDPDCFEDSICLLREKHEILWVSLDNPPSMY